MLECIDEIIHKDIDMLLSQAQNHSLRLDIKEFKERHYIGLKTKKIQLLSNAKKELQQFKKRCE